MLFWKKKMAAPAVGRPKIQLPCTWRERIIRSLPIYGVLLATTFGILNSSRPAVVLIAIGLQVVLTIVSVRIWL
jgi:hypothetical protein